MTYKPTTISNVSYVAANLGALAAQYSQANKPHKAPTPAPPKPKPVTKSVDKPKRKLSVEKLNE